MSWTRNVDRSRYRCRMNRGILSASIRAATDTVDRRTPVYIKNKGMGEQGCPICTVPDSALCLQRVDESRPSRRMDKVSPSEIDPVSDDAVFYIGLIGLPSVSLPRGLTVHELSNQDFRDSIFPRLVFGSDHIFSANAPRHTVTVLYHTVYP
jgi:hypothetical protein